mmetsp:Transcript_32109/g.60473  ORF Transcript_32109/g.60473 Transcript_32109/m.60473 type:complete len:338 (+) Transcript_32109:62-1075(+)
MIRIGVFGLVAYLEIAWCSPDSGTCTSSKSAVLLQHLVSHTMATPETQAIPNLVFFTGAWEPEDIVNANRKWVPKGTEFRYYNYHQLALSVDEISKELVTQGVHGAAAAFHELRPHAFRADLWRLMILWQQGGIYLDAKLMLKAPLSSWVDQQQDELALCWDDPAAYAFGATGLFYWNAMLAARKHQPLLLSVIKKIISNVENHYYGEKQNPADSKLLFEYSFNPALSITGPILVTRVLNGTSEINVSKGEPRATCTWTGNGNGMVVSTDGSQIAEVNATVHEAMHNCTSCDAYYDLVAQKQVYCSEPGPPCPDRLAMLAFPSEEQRDIYTSWTVGM